jgi:hypothetical protein
MKIREYEIFMKNYEVKKSKIDPVEDNTSRRFEDLRFDRIYDSDRISGAANKGMITKAHDIGTPEV